MKQTIFREYDIRGIVGDELVIDQVYDLTRAIAFYLMQANPQLKSLAVGMDGRVHSQQIKDELCRALRDGGIDVTFIGVCHSPMLYFATHALPVDGGLMVTASHNPKEYNGIKICLGTEFLSGKQIKDIGTAYYEKKHVNSQVQGVYTDQPLVDVYVEWHVNQFAHLQKMDFAMVLDCANGAAGAVIPSLVDRMGWKQVQALYPEVDGTFPNHEADPSAEKNMQDVKKVLDTTDAVVGIGFDGDADRMGAMTKTGVLVPGDKLLAIFAQPMVQQHPGMTVVYNVVCSAGLGELLAQWGAKSCVTAVGHSIIDQKMHETNGLLGGETSCHFFFRDRHFGYDDGVYAMLRLVEILVNSGKTLDELIAIFPPKVTSPEFRIPCTEDSKWAIMEDIKNAFLSKKDVDVLTIDGVRAATCYGWGIVRPSNTQPVLSMRFESDTPSGLAQIKEDFAQVLAQHYDKEYLVHQLQM